MIPAVLLQAAMSAVHAEPPPAPASVAFMILVAILFFGLSVWLRTSGGLSPRAVDRIRGGLAAWLILTASLARLGVFADFWSIPPKIALAVAPAMLFCIVVALLPKTGPWLDRAPGLWILGFQTFRIAMELILWQLGRAGALPVSMTFEGRNFDVLVGLTAPLVAWLAFARRWVSPFPVILWNVFGMVILGNVVVIGALSAPTRFQRFFEHPPNEVIGHFPFAWLVAFVVPLAFLGHLLSIRQQVRVLRASRAPKSSTS